jgi:hypothetical protein
MVYFLYILPASTHYLCPPVKEILIQPVCLNFPPTYEYWILIEKRV